jgi:hypothetical protein
VETLHRKGFNATSVQDITDTATGAQQARRRTGRMESAIESGVREARAQCGAILMPRWSRLFF